VAGSAPRILLVDDEQSVQKLLTYPLRKEGYEVVGALDGREALDRLQDASFDLVVLDVMLPHVDGFDVCRQIRATSTVPIIMLTAKTEEIDKVLGLELGADDYLGKPFSMRELIARIRVLFRRAARRASGNDETVISVGSLDLDPRHRRVAQIVVDHVANRNIFVEKLRVVLLGEPVRFPILDNPQAKANRMDFVTH